MSSIDDIDKEFHLRRAEIDALDQALARERVNIQDAAMDAGRLVNAAEKKRRKEIGATRHELADAMIVLSLVTLSRLRNSADVENLNKEMARINDQLKDDLEHLQDLEGYAETAAKVANGLASAVEKVAELAL